MIYLDHAAATPVSKKVLEAMMPFFETEFFNPSAAYLPAKKVREAYEAAKNDLAHTIGAKSADLVITAGATEANNLAFTVVSTAENPATNTTNHENIGTCPKISNLGPTPSVPSRLSPNLGTCPTAIDDTDSEKLDTCPKISTSTRSKILYLETEHASVRNLAQNLGGTAVKVLPLNGRVDLADLKVKIADETELISVSLVNNEIGVIQPLAEIAAIVREERLRRLKQRIKTPLYLHSDASQALGLLNISVARLGVDLLTLNSAKIYGPKGIGALYKAHNVRLRPLVYGGGQEQGLRSGTENVPGLIGFATAAKEAKDHLNGNRKKYAEFKKLFLDELRRLQKTQELQRPQRQNSDFTLVPTANTLDNFVNLCYNGIDGERLIYLLEAEGVYLATGAACAASKGEKSYVLEALGLSDPEIKGSLRITFGATNTKEQVVEAAQIINRIARREKERLQNG